MSDVYNRQKDDFLPWAVVRGTLGRYQGEPSLVPTLPVVVMQALGN